MTTRRYVWPVDMRLCIPSSNGVGGFVVAIDTGQSRGTVGTVVVITDVSPAWKNRNDIMMSSLVIQSMHSKRRVVMMPTLSSLVAPQTCGATSGDKVDITTTFGLQIINSVWKFQGFQYKEYSLCRDNHHNDNTLMRLSYPWTPTLCKPIPGNLGPPQYKDRLSRCG